MEGDPTVGEGIVWALRFFSDIAFRWVPGTVEVIAGTAPVSGPTLVYTPITTPVTTSDVTSFLQTAGATGAYERLFHDWSILVAVSIFLSLLLAAAVIYCLIRLVQVRSHEEQKVLAAGSTVVAKDVRKTQLRWNRILEQVQSDIEQNWRLAILEADIMLNELLDVLGYKGETMADKMKQIDRAHFNSIDLAWEAHRVRNAIAHQGAMQEITQHEARRVIALYGQVFREYHFID